MYVCMYVCIYISIYVFMNARMHIRIYDCRFLNLLKMIFYSSQIELERTAEDRDIDAIADYVLRLEMQISRVRNRSIMKQHLLGSLLLVQLHFCVDKIMRKILVLKLIKFALRIFS